jgi:hypothetical protein
VCRSRWIGPSKASGYVGTVWEWIPRSMKPYTHMISTKLLEFSARDPTSTCRHALRKTHMCEVCSAKRARGRGTTLIQILESYSFHVVGLVQEETLRGTRR